MLFYDAEDIILTLGKKEFSYYKHQDVFRKNEGEWVSRLSFEYHTTRYHLSANQSTRMSNKVMNVYIVTRI